MRARAEQWTYLHLPARPDDEVEPESAYLSVFLQSAHVVDVRRGLRRLYGTVNSSLALPTRAGTTARFASTVSPASLHDVDPDHLDRFVQLNHRLLGPVPYIGGDVEAEVGLFSVASSDLAGPYLRLLESLSQAASVAFIGLASPFIEPIKQGINALAGVGDGAALEIGFSTTWRPPRLGRVVVIRTPASARAAYQVDEDDGRLLNASGQPIVDAPYLVLQISAETRRDDWTSIPELADAWAYVQREYRAGSVERTEEALTFFRRVALTCNDLLFDDALRLVEQAVTRYRDLGAPTPGVRGGSWRELPPLASLSPFADKAKDT